MRLGVSDMALLYKLDARDALSRMFSDTAKTTPISDGTALAAWEPSGGTIADDLVQGTLGARPIYRANYNSSGHPAADFDGSNDFMSAVDDDAWDVANVTVVVAARIATATGDRLLAHKWSPTNWNNGWGFVQTGSRLGGATFSWISGGQPFSTGAGLMFVRTNGAYRDTGYNGRYFGGNTNVTLPTNSQGFSVGGPNFFAHMGFHYISVWDTSLTNDELDAELYAVDQAFGLGQYSLRGSSGTAGFTGIRGVSRRLGT